LRLRRVRETTIATDIDLNPFSCSSFSPPSLGRCQPLGGHPPVATEILGVKLRDYSPPGKQISFMNVAQPLAGPLDLVESLHGPWNPERKLDLLKLLHHPGVPQSGRDDLLARIRHPNRDGQGVTGPGPALLGQ